MVFKDISYIGYKMARFGLESACEVIMSSPQRLLRKLFLGRLKELVKMLEK
jgi:hypothetical protein